jgi:hypothetical protein
MYFKSKKGPMADTREHKHLQFKDRTGHFDVIVSKCFRCSVINCSKTWSMMSEIELFVRLNVTIQGVVVCVSCCDTLMTLLQCNISS